MGRESHGRLIPAECLNQKSYRVEPAQIEFFFLQRLRARKASLAELQTIHSENHVRLYGRPSQRKPGQEKKDTGRAFIQLNCGGVGVDRDTYWNDAHTSNASRMVRECLCYCSVIVQLFLTTDIIHSVFRLWDRSLSWQIKLPMEK